MLGEDGLGLVPKALDVLHRSVATSKGHMSLSESFEHLSPWVGGVLQIWAYSSSSSHSITGHDVDPTLLLNVEVELRPFGKTWVFKKPPKSVDLRPP